MTELRAVKFLDEEAGIIEGLILPYGGPLNGSDFTKTRFTKSTDYCADWFPDGGRPGLYAHGFDPALGVSVIGRETKSWKDAKGVWLQAQLDKAHQYWAEIKQMVDDGILSLSSGAVDHLVKATKSGDITLWPWVEWTLTPIPANPDAVVYAVRSADATAHLAAVGMEKVMEPVKAKPAVKGGSSASSDAASGATVLQILYQILPDEIDEPEQAPLIQSAIDSITKWLPLEVAEIGTPGDANTEAYGYLSLDRAVREGKRNSTSDASHLQQAHDHIAAAAGMACAPSDDGSSDSSSEDSGSGKALGTPAASALAVKAGGDVAPAEVDPKAVRDRAAELAVAEVRRQIRP